MSHRILFFTPLPASNLVDQWHRDQGLLVETTRAQGYDAHLVARLPAPITPNDRLIAAADEDLRNADWWKNQNPWAVVTNTWGAPRFDTIRNAILQATPRLLDRLDTDGARSPYICWPSYLYRDWSAYRDYTMPQFRYLAFWHSLGRGITRQLFPRTLDKRLAASLASIPIITAESPIAVERMKRFLRLFGHKGENIRLLPHPIDSKNIPEIAVTRKNRVISVGRWDAHQKNFPLLLRVLHGFLVDHPDWDAALPGRRHPKTEHLLSKYCPTTISRIQVPGPLPNAEIHQLMADSKIFLMASRHESFGIAAAEALCLGCSVVGPAHIPSVPWFCGSDSGTVATVYTCNGLLDALSAENAAWSQQERQPNILSKKWLRALSAEYVAKKIVSILKLTNNTMS